LFQYRQVFLSLSKCKQFQQNVIPLHVAPTTLALCFCNSIIHASTHHFPLQLSHSHRSYHYPTWRTTYLKAARDKQKYGGMVIFQQRYNLSSTEGTRDSFSLSALLPILRAFVWFPTDQPSFVVHTRPSLHSFPVTLCIYHLHHRSPLSATISIPPHFIDRLSHLGNPSSIRVRYKVYFILHFIVFFKFLLFILTSVPMGLVTRQRSVYFFGSF